MKRDFTTDLRFPPFAFSENISNDQQREKEREREREAEREREKEREKEREREKNREKGRDDRERCDSDRMRDRDSDRERSRERHERDRDRERGSSLERFSKEGSPVASRGASQEVSPPQPQVPEGKPWNYPGLDIMATGAFWQNYSGKFLFRLLS